MSRWCPPPRRNCSLSADPLTAFASPTSRATGTSWCTMGWHPCLLDVRPLPGRIPRRARHPNPAFSGGSSWLLCERRPGSGTAAAGAAAAPPAVGAAAAGPPPPPAAAGRGRGRGAAVPAAVPVGVLVPPRRPRTGTPAAFMEDLVSAASLRLWLEATAPPCFLAFRNVVGFGSDAREQSVRDLHLLRFGTEDQKQVLVASLACRAPIRARLSNLFSMLPATGAPGAMASYLGRLCRAVGVGEWCITADRGW